MMSLQECYHPPNILLIKGEFIFRHVESLYGLQTLILSKEKINLKINKIGYGPFGLPNKGFISIKINNSILYLNAHLSAHEYNHIKRLKQISNMLNYVTSDSINTIILSGDLNFRMENGKDQSTDLFKIYENFIVGYEEVCNQKLNKIEKRFVSN